MRTLLFIIFICFLWSMLHQVSERMKGKVICRNCGSCARPAIISPRNLFIEIILWFSALIPGVLYTLWCKHETHAVCEKCGSRDIVPEDSPVGRSLAERMQVDVTPISEQSKKTGWK